METDDSMPSIQFTWKDTRIEISFVRGVFRLALKASDGAASLYLKERLGESYALSGNEHLTFWMSAVDNVEAAIDQITQIARDFDAGDPESVAR